MKGSPWRAGCQPAGARRGSGFDAGQFSQAQAPAAQPVPHEESDMQQESPASQADGGAGALEAPRVRMPAPPLINRCTVPPQEGQASSSGSDIFWRRSKCESQLRHSYAYAGMGIS